MPQADQTEQRSAGLVQLGAQRRRTAQLDTAGKVVDCAPADRSGSPIVPWSVPDSGLQREAGWNPGWNLEKAKC